jgi:hypothetical protein
MSPDNIQSEKYNRGKHGNFANANNKKLMLRSGTKVGSALDSRFVQTEPSMGIRTHGWSTGIPCPVERNQTIDEPGRRSVFLVNYGP